MVYNYINKDGNHASIDCLNLPDTLEQIDGKYFEKRVEKKVKEEVIKEEVTDTKDVEIRAKEFLREKKVTGFGLLKGNTLIKKAQDLGFII